MTVEQSISRYRELGPGATLSEIAEETGLSWRDIEHELVRLRATRLEHEQDHAIRWQMS